MVKLMSIRRLLFLVKVRRHLILHLLRYSFYDSLIVQSLSIVQVKTPRDRDSEKKQLSDYRRHSISASIYDPLSLRDVIKRSSDNLVILGDLVWRLTLVDLIKFCRSV